MKAFYKKVINLISGKEETEEKPAATSAPEKPATEITPEQKRQDELAEMEARQNALYAKLTQAPREHQEKLLNVIHQLQGVYNQGKGKTGSTKSGGPEGRRF